MWTDNETTADLLGFRVHAELLESVVTNPSLLPSVVGLFGDWGSGKSSIMKMLEGRLNSEDYKDVACLYFNGWAFEGYQDAKSALLSSILSQLADNKKFGSKAKDYAVALLKRVKFMEIAKAGGKYVALPLLATLLTGGAGAAAALAVAIGHGALNRVQSEANENGAQKVELSDFISDPESDAVKVVGEFREKFAEMLDKTKLSSLVIIIDDLDRCLPERIIETLEAIKLFVSVPNTAFVIGADPRIVRHALATRYAAKQVDDRGEIGSENYDLVQDYIEKLIQVPYYLPRLSPTEIETYINLLGCTKFLEQEDASKVLEHWRSRRKINPHKAYRRSDIAQAIGNVTLLDKLESQLSWSEAVSPVLTEGLKGNPRQIKRMLNSMLLRQQLAAIAGIPIKQEILAKLMVLEYAHEKRFRELGDWQATQNGQPMELKFLEEAVLSGEQMDLPGEVSKEWALPSLRRWLSMAPSLRNIDLRDYFWLVRDRSNSTLVGVNMVSPFVRRLFTDLTDGSRPKKHAAAKQSAEADLTEQSSLIDLLSERIKRHPDEEAAAEGLLLLSTKKVPGAARALVLAVLEVGSRVSPSVPLKLGTVATNEPALKEEIKKVLDMIASTGGATPTAAAAKQVLGNIG